jgi:hypothetical protein
MSRRKALVTQADIARAIRAAKQEKAAGVEVRPDGTIAIRLSTEFAIAPSLAPQGAVDDSSEIVL